MSDQSQGVAWGNWLVSKASGLLDAKLNRRSFIARTTLVGTAVAATGCAVVTQPGPPYQRITDCPPGTLCTDGYTEFCCVINQGVNFCPPNTIPAGWWRADGSIYCNGGPRYFVDCNEICCGPSLGNGFCAGCSPCRCATDCNTRKVHCNYFRYGQCNNNAPYDEVGPIACRLVLCAPPYDYPFLDCSMSSASDDSTANHNADCAAYAPPPPPPPVDVVLPTSVAAFAMGTTGVVVATRDSTGALAYLTFDGTSWASAFNTSLGGQINSRVAAVSDGTNASLFIRGTDAALWRMTATASGSTPTWGAWTRLGGIMTSDPAPTIDGGTVWVYLRGSDGAVWTTPPSGPFADLGGDLSSDLAPVVTPSGGAAVFARGLDASLWSITRTGGTWGAWTREGATLASDPDAVCDSSGNISVVLRGTDNNVYVFSPGGSFTGLGSPTGGVTSDPVAVVDQSNVVWVFVRGADNQVYSATGPTWTWTTLGAQQVSADPSPLAAAGSLWVFAIGTDSKLWVQRHTGGTWSGWQNPDATTTLAPVHT